MAEKVKPKARSAASRVIAQPLDEGDWVEYGNTVEIKTHKGSYWPKMSAGSKVRPGETAQDALERIVDFVNSNLMEAAEALK